MNLRLLASLIICFRVAFSAAAGAPLPLLSEWQKLGLSTEVPYGLENADTDGSPRFRVSLPIDGFGDAVLEYSGSGRYVAGSCLGHNWWFPLLESGVVELDETRVVVRWPTGGETEMLRSDEPGVFHSPDLGFKGRLTGDLFVVSSRDTEVTFKKGRIWKLASTGHQLEWNYTGQRVTSVEGMGRRLLELAYSKRTGMLESIRTPAGERLHFESSMVPVYSNGLLAALQPRVSRAGSGIQEIFSVIYEDEPENGRSAIHVLQTGQAEKILRASQDGRTLLSDTGGTYTVRRDDPYSEAYPRIDYSSKQGVISSWFDPKTWSNFCVDAKGVVSEAKVVVTPGALYGKLRGLQVKNADGDVISTERNYYDNEGQLLRRVSSAEGSRYYFKESEGLNSSLGPKDTAFWFNKAGRLIKFYSSGSYYTVGGPDDKGTQSKSN